MLFGEMKKEGINTYFDNESKLVMALFKYYWVDTVKN